MLTLVDITFHANKEYENTSSLIRAQYSSLVYVETMQSRIRVEVIKHIAGGNTVIEAHPHVRFFSGRNRAFYIPFATLRYLEKKRPDIVLVQGLVFPVQVMALKYILGEKTKIIVKHHADKPFRSPKRLLQKQADKYIDGYLFTSYGNAKEWISSGVIGNHRKVHELPATYTHFSKKNKAQCREKLGMGQGLHYLWVGRLDANKDPLTVVAAFEEFLSIEPSAVLHMIYQSAAILPALQQRIAASPCLRQAVKLHGLVPYDGLPEWYSAADFFISASHTEAGSAALLEAMACGCIPIVTAIPSSLKMIANGKYGFFFKPGDRADLFDTLAIAAGIAREELSVAIEDHFRKEFSVGAVCDKLYGICLGLTTE